MAKIYISSYHADTEIVRRISEELQNRGHEILFDNTVLKVGHDWRKVLLESLKDADGVLVFITENSLKSNYVVSEIGTARAYVAESDNRKFIIPVIYRDIPIPNFISDLFCIRLDENNFDETISKIDTSIASFLGRQEAAKENQRIEKERVEIKAADFIKDATKALNKRKWHNMIVAYLCYLIGISTLIWGIIIGLNGLNGLSNVQELLNKHPSQMWGIYILVILKSLIVIGLLIACSKYVFTLGRSFMHESLRNADRIHAISFGEFFLKAYGDKVGSHSEIKEIFQEWNIDKPSAFSSIDANSYDPKFSDNLVEIIKTLSNKVKGGD
jgi:hypothetical protein